MSLAGAAILVTGATGAIGGEIAAQAAAQGAVVGVHGASAASVSAAIQRLAPQAASGARLIPAPADFRREDDVSGCVDAFAAEAGGLDAVIHCAIAGSGDGGRITGPFATTTPARYGAHAALVLGVFQNLCHAALPHLQAEGRIGSGGTIIAFASDAGRFASPRQSLVGAAFGGIMACVRNLAVELARDGIRVHCISPSFVKDTPVYQAFAQGGRGDAAAARAGLGLPSPADIAPMALFLCGPGAAKITGQIISINGGLNA